MSPDKDLIVIGGGPGGITAGQYAARANLNVLVIEELATGGQALNISDLENYPGIAEPIPGYDLAEKMEKQAQDFGAEILYTTAIELKKENGIFYVKTADGEYTSYAVVLATGAKHRHLGVPGEKEFTGRGVSYCATCDGPFFRDKHILVVGGGDSACDEASFLSKLSSRITVVHRRDRFRAQKALADRVMANRNISVKFNKVVKEIKGKDKVKSVILQDTVSGKVSEEKVDAVFVFIGSDPQTSLVPDIKTDEGGFIITNQRMETGTHGLFAVGDLRATPFRQIVVSAGEGAVAAHCAEQYIDDIKGLSYN